ncbi:MAG: glycosyltransferase, partial [Prevotellaceae bacterium]|nr:glycosyltransferase [Prevotellaceae bacterium]
MNILFIYIDDGSWFNNCAKIHFINELEREGHKLFFFNPDLYLSVVQANEILSAIIKENRNSYDLIVHLHGDEILFPDTVKQIKRTGIPTLLICFDNLQSPFMHKNIAPHFDLVWLTSFETKSMFEKWGCKCIFLPYAANPHNLYPDFSEEINAVGFVGTPYGTRIHKINKLIDNNIECSVYSSSLINNGFTAREKKKKPLIKIDRYDIMLMRYSIVKRILISNILKKIISQPDGLSLSPCLTVKPSVTLEQMNRLYSNHSLSLNITEVWDTYLLKKPVHKLHLRTFEIPMCGGLQFAPYIEELAGYFEDGKEIVMYKNEAEYI